MNQVLQPRFAALLKRVFLTRGADPGTTLIPTVSPTYETGDPAYRPEDRLVRGERLCALGGTLQMVTAGGGGQETILNNPPNVAGPQQGTSLIVIKRITVSGQLPTATVQPGRGGMLVEVFPTGAIAAGTLGNPKDQRNGNLSRGNVSATTAIAYSAGAWGSKLLGFNFGNTVFGMELTPQATTSPFQITYDQADIVLEPGGKCGVGVWFDTTPTATWNYTTTFEWYERTMDVTELLIPPS